MGAAGRSYLPSRFLPVGMEHASDPSWHASPGGVDRGPDPPDELSVDLTHDTDPNDDSALLSPIGSWPYGCRRFSVQGGAVRD